MQFSGKWRHLGTRALSEDGAQQAPITSVVDMRRGYKSFYVDIFNVLDEDDFDIAYFYTSRLQGEDPVGVDDTHFHSVKPRKVRATLKYE